MSRQELVTRIKDNGLVAVVRAESAEKAYRIVDACIEGGVAGIEITFTVPGAHKIIEDLASKYTSGDIILGAGTVLDPETARIAILSGAQYIVSPNVNLDTIKLCNRYQVPSMPGAMTIKEILEAMEAGADIIKIFPGNLFGPAIIKSVMGPIPQAPMMPTGGVSIETVKDWIEAGAVAVGAGSSLTNGAKTGDYAAITAMAKEFLKRIKEARGE
ncbi:MAG: bifunctional 2-keto-4-hydroxyglutarate aldolase/2-keto-3-deoxy-6-phosphogluconate aldolase [Clostridiales bacterium]|nr:bifunctional 2-keto-4-hydroxyglutarate aldolase/2-keto-3-deoxy-6-phosphogluconate aldolase [Clostridiales bacterium]